MNPAYFQTLFSIEERWNRMPGRFAIVSAHATTGETWPDDENRAADARLREALSTYAWVTRIVGYSPAGDHAEDSWAVEMTFDEACDLGLQFKQEAIYYVEDGTLFVSFCDERRACIEVGPFSERVTDHPRKT